MPDPEPKANSPIEITIKIDPASVQSVIKRPAKALWRAATGETARVVYWLIGVLAALLLLAAVIVNQVISGRVLGVFAAIAIAAGLLALKRRYSPLIRD